MVFGAGAKYDISLPIPPRSVVDEHRFTFLGSTFVIWCQINALDDRSDGMVKCVNSAPLNSSNSSGVKDVAVTWLDRPATSHT
jgi:hypothetical protein